MDKISKETIFEELKNLLVNEFEISEDKITGGSTLFEDLDLDSIDAVDIAVRMQKYTNKKISPEKFKEIKTVDDVVNSVYELING